MPKGNLTIRGIALLGVSLIISACNREIKMAPLPPCFSSEIPEEVPVIVAAEVLERSHPVSSPQNSEWENGRVAQVWSVKIRIEQVLQGEVKGNRQEREIFYVVDLGMGDSPFARVMGDLYAGHSELFFLQPDNGRLRTICDGSRSCIIWVRTESHYHFHVDASQSIREALVDLLLSRGDHTTDEQMLDAMYHAPVQLEWGKRHFYQAFRRIADGDPSPKGPCCSFLRSGCGTILVIDSLLGTHRSTL